jgi:hypothetical protein
MTHVRESSRFGFCYALGELIGETDETPLGGPSGMLVQDQPRC